MSDVVYFCLIPPAGKDVELGDMKKRLGDTSNNLQLLGVGELGAERHYAKYYRYDATGLNKIGFHLDLLIEFDATVVTWVPQELDRYLSGTDKYDLCQLMLKELEKRYPTTKTPQESQSCPSMTFTLP